jgi:hypothetical protein
MTTNWFSDQWKQIRGNVKYEVLRFFVIVLGGSGIIAALGTMLHKAFLGINADWFIFGGVFTCSVLVFSIALFRPALKTAPEEPSNPDRVRVENLSETVKLGALWQVATEICSPVHVELREIRSEREVVIEVTSIAIQYAGARVQTLSKNIQTGRYILQRAAVDYGNDCVSHWDMGDASFNGFYVYLIHANPYAQEATLGFFVIDAYAFSGATKAKES